MVQGCERGVDFAERLVGHHDPALDPRDQRRNGLGKAQQRLIHANKGRFAVIDDVAEFLGRQPQVQLQQNGPQAGDCIVELEVSTAVPIEHTHPVRGTDAELPESVAGAAHPRIAITIGIALPIAVRISVYDLLLAVGSGRMANQRRGVELVVIAHGGWAAGDDGPAPGMAAIFVLQRVLPCRD